MEQMPVDLAHEAIIAAITAHIRIHALMAAGYDLRDLNTQAGDLVDGINAVCRNLRDGSPVNLLLADEL